MMPFTLIALFLLLLVGVAWLLWQQDFEGMRSARTYRLDLKKRHPLSDEEFYAAYYAGSAISTDLVARLLRVTATYWNVDSKYIRPQDNYGMIFGDIDTARFVTCIEDEFCCELSEEDCEQIDGSFDGIVRYLDRRQRMTGSLR